MGVKELSALKQLMAAHSHISIHSSVTVRKIYVLNVISSR